MPQPLDFIDRIVASGDNEGSLMSVKRLLIETFGVAQGFAAYREKMTHLREQGDIRRKPLAGLQQVARQRAAAYRDIADAETFAIPPAKVIDGGDYPTLQGRARPMFVACLIDARVRARSNVIEFADLALLDREGDELTRFDDQLDFDASLFQASGDAAWVITPPGDRAGFELDEAFSLLGVRPHVFGHWLIEHLAKYVAASASGALPAVPVLVEAGMPATHYEALRLMLAEPVEIVQLPPFATARVRRLWCAPTPSLFPWAEVQNRRYRPESCAMPPARYAAIFREMARRGCRETPAARRVERVFLARKPGFAHRLVNSEVIEAAARARGFELFFAEDLPFVEQMELLRHARFILGPEGSAMILSWFAAADAKVCSMTAAAGVLDLQCAERGIFAALGVDFTVFAGPGVRLNPEDPARSDFEIDAARFCRFLDEWLIS